MFSGGGGFKRGVIGLSGLVRLSEDTSGESVKSPFRRASTMPNSAVISALARSLMAGEPTVEGVHARATRTLGRPWRWLRPLAPRYIEAFGGRTRPRHRDVIRFLLQDPGFVRARAAHRDKLAIAEWLAEPPRMQPAGAAQQWDLPVIETSGDLASWLSVHATELEWFADLKGLGYKLHSPKLQHYCYHVQPKRSGGVRLIESPKRELKELQRWILHRSSIGSLPIRPSTDSSKDDLSSLLRRLMWASISCCDSIWRISFPHFQPRVCKPCFERSDIPSR
jgi:hypothetical protein